MAPHAPFRATGPVCLLACLLLGPSAPTQAAPYRVTGTGFVTSDSHPMHPGYYYTYKLTARLAIDPELGEAVLALETTTEGGHSDTDR